MEQTIGGVREIAQAMGYNYTYLSHVFSRVTGVTLQKYISQKKIERARQLLLQLADGMHQGGHHVVSVSRQNIGLLIAILKGLH